MCCSSPAKALLALIALSISACNSVGAGTQPTGLVVGGPSGETSVDIAECSIFNLYAYLEVNDEVDTTADFSSRVDWSSDNPTIAEVSNGDVVPEGLSDGQVYQRGVVIARQPGAATIRAHYLDFSSTIVINVSGLSALSIEPALTTLAAGTSQQFVLQGQVADSVEAVDFSANAQWSFTTPTTNLRLSDDASGTLIAGSSGDSTTTLQARLSECGRHTSTQLKVATPSAYRIEYDNGDNPRLPLGYSEAFSVWADFNSGQSQNLSAQISTDLDDDDPLQALVAQSSPPGQERVLIYTQAETADQAFEIILPGEDEIRLISKAWTVSEQDLQAISSPQTESQLVFPDTAQLQVMGQFDDGNVLDISRHVDWSSADDSLLSVSNVAANAGEIAGANLNARVEVEALAPQNADLDPLRFSIQLSAAP